MHYLMRVWKKNNLIKYLNCKKQNYCNIKIQFNKMIRMKTLNLHIKETEV